MRLACALLAAGCALASAQTAAEPSVPACEQAVHADASAALAMADGLLAPLDPAREAGPYHEALGCKAWALALLDRREEAIALAERMSAAAASIAEVESRVRVLRRAASVHQSLDRFDPAVELLSQALRLTEQAGLTGLGIEVTTNLAVLHSTANQFEPAIAHLERALATALETEDRRRELPVRFNLGQTYRSAKRFADAAATLEPLVPALEAPGMESRLASLLGSLGWLRLQTGEPAAAERHFARAAALLAELDNPAELTVVLNGQTQLLLQRGDIAAASARVEQSIAAARRAGDYTSLSSALSLAVDVSEAAGRPADALAHLRERSELAVQNISEQQRSRLNELEVQLGVERQARELDQLRQERERQTLALQAQRRNLLLALGLVGLGVLALLWQRHVNRRLHRLSRTDQLTGLLNRRGLAERMERAANDPEEVSLVVLIDIDHFKSINDRHGHATGDRVLAALGAALGGFAREHRAEAARWGGEEFALLTRARGAEHAAALATALGGLPARLDVRNEDGEAVRLTISLGFAPLLAGDAHRPAWQNTLRLADELLYRAKRDGRDRGLGLWPDEARTTASAEGVDALLAGGGWRLLATGGSVARSTPGA